MKKLIAIIATVTLLPLVATAQNVGQCGWGSKLFHDQKGIAPQVLAVTTNGTSGNQTFGITSGTSGCTQEGVVKSSWKTAAFVDENMTRFAHDLSRGNGESLETFVSLLEVDAADKASVQQVLQQNFDAIFYGVDVSSAEVLASVRTVLLSNENLARYAANV